MNILETKNLTVGYDKKKVAGNINLSVEKGQLVCLLGPNGSGKSTILKSLSALLAPINGTIFIKGRDLKDISRRSLSKSIAVVLTEKLSVGFLNAFDVAAMGRHPHTGFLGGLKESDREIVWSCLRMVNAENIAQRYFNELSDGERQKIMLARALAQEPELIILDEPTTHLDIRHKLEVLSILKKLSRQKGITVILSLHEVDLALKSCDFAVMVKNGKIANMGLPERIGTNEAVCNLYDIECAGFSAFLGTMELSNKNVPNVFVVGGGGNATGIFRQLTRSNIGFNAGILHENDVDCHIAETMGVQIVSEKPFEVIGEKPLKMAKELIIKAEAVIDSGFHISEINQANQKLIVEAAANGKPVYTFRNELESKRLFGEWALKMHRCETISDIVSNCVKQHNSDKSVSIDTGGVRSCSGNKHE